MGRLPFYLLKLNWTRNILRLYSIRPINTKNACAGITINNRHFTDFNRILKTEKRKLCRLKTTV